MFNIFLTSQTFSWLLGLMSGTSSIRGISGSTNSKTETWRIFIIYMLSGKSSSYITRPKIFIILKGSSLIKSNLLLGLMIWINVIFMFSIFFKRYTLSFSLRVGLGIQSLRYRHVGKRCWIGE